MSDWFLFHFNGPVVLW